MRKFIIGKINDGQRLDRYLLKLFKNAPGGIIYKQIRNRNITLNGRKAKETEILHENDELSVFMSDETIDTFMGSIKSQAVTDNEKFRVVYEDDNVIIADKPQGILSQKATENDISMNEYLVDYMLKNGMDRRTLSVFRPAFCNRLDRNTGGLMIGGKTLAGLRKMSEIIKDRTVRKFYLAIVKGKISEKKHTEGYLYKDEIHNRVTVSAAEMPDSQLIITEYEPVSYKEGMTLLKVELFTGKTHQIRAQLASEGHPVLGDSKYGDRTFNRNHNAVMQFLHAYELVFPDMDGELSSLSGKTVRTEYPEKFKRFFKETEIWHSQGG